MTKRRKRRDPVRLLLPLIVVLILVGTILFALQKPKPVFASDLRFPVGSEITLSQVVIDVKNGALSDPNRVLDSSKEGSIKVIFTMKNILHVESEGNCLIEFYPSDESGNNAGKDQTDKEMGGAKPVITSPDTLYLYVGEEPDFSREISALDTDGNALEVKVNGKYDMNVAGDYDLTLEAEDAKGAKAEKTMKLSVLKTPFGENGALIDGVYTTKNGKKLEVKGGIAYVDGILIANKSYSLPKTYTSSYLTEETERAYYELQKGAADAGHTLKIKSAYRSWNDQNYIFNGYVKEDGLEEALTFSARPGHSEHQTGLAMDIVTSSSVESRTPEIKAILDWLNENAYKYGFILRYPEEKTDITGYIFEPWHYRYVGEELAETLYNGGDWITLEEYFGIDSIYRGY